MRPHPHLHLVSDSYDDLPFDLDELEDLPPLIYGLDDTLDTLRPALPRAATEQEKRQIDQEVFWELARERTLDTALDVVLAVLYGLNLALICAPVVMIAAVIIEAYI